MQSPVIQQQHLYRTLAPRVASPALEDTAVRSDELSLFDTVLQSYGLETESPGMEVDLTPLLHSDELAGWQPPSWLMQGATSMQEQSTQQPSNQQMQMPTEQIPPEDWFYPEEMSQQLPFPQNLAQQIFTQQMSAQQLSTQHLPLQPMLALNMLDLGISAGQRSVQHMPSRSTLGQAWYTQQPPAQHVDMLTQYMQSPQEQLPMRDMYLQRSDISETYMQQSLIYPTPMENMDFQPMPHHHVQSPPAYHHPPANAAPAQTAPAHLTIAPPPDLKLCIKCHAHFDPARNHGMACFRHKDKTSVVDHNASEWYGWDDLIHGPKDQPLIREQFPTRFVWLCCRRPGSAPGCMSDEHVPEGDEDAVMQAAMEAAMWAADAAGAADAADAAEQILDDDEQSVPQTTIWAIDPILEDGRV